MSTPALRLVIVRHGESHANVGGLITGHDTCSGLTELGQRQAEALRDRLLATEELAGADTVFTSVLARAIETERILRPALPNATPVRSECDWCEIHPGEAEGLTFSQFREQAPDFADPHDPYRSPVPGMESWAEFYARVGTRLERVADEHAGQCVVVVGHGGTVGASLVALGGIPIRRGNSFTAAPSNGSMTEWRHDDDGWRLVRYNDDSHLSGVEIPDRYASHPSDRLP